MLFFFSVQVRISSDRSESLQKCPVNTPLCAVMTLGGKDGEHATTHDLSRMMSTHTEKNFLSPFEFRIGA